MSKSGIILKAHKGQKHNSSIDQLPAKNIITALTATKIDPSFLAPTGAQEMALSVRLSVCVSVTFMNSSLNLHSFFTQS